MKFTTIMIIKAVAALVLGVILLSVPGLLLTLVGIPDSLGAAI